MRTANPIPIGDSPEAGEDNVPAEATNLDSAEDEEVPQSLEGDRFGF